MPDSPIVLSRFIVVHAIPSARRARVARRDAKWQRSEVSVHWQRAQYTKRTMWRQHRGTERKGPRPI